MFPSWLGREDPTPIAAGVLLQLPSLTTRTCEDKNTRPASPPHQQSLNTPLAQTATVAQVVHSPTHSYIFLLEKKRNVALLWVF